MNTTCHPPFSQAYAHLFQVMDREVLLAARMQPSEATVQEAMRVIEAFPTAMALECFAARPWERMGRHEEALEARQRALSLAPRWDSWETGVLLRGLSRSLLACGQPGAALDAARQGLRFCPADPYLVHACAEALTRIDPPASWPFTAYLRDAGYGPPLVSDRCPDEERDVEPYVPDLSDVEPLDDGAYVCAAALLDVAPDPTALHMARRAAWIAIRRGELGQARLPLVWVRGWQTYVDVPMRWLGMEGLVSTECWATRRLLQEVDATPQARASAALGRKKAPSRFSEIDTIRVDAVAAYQACGAEADLVAMLSDPILAVRLAAQKALGDHPIASAIRHLRDETGAWRPARTNEWGFGPTGPMLFPDGGTVLFPVPEGPVPEIPHPFVSFIEVNREPKARCKACKGLFGPGERRLAHPITDTTTDLYHLSCASEKKALREALHAARARSRLRD